MSPLQRLPIFALGACYLCLVFSPAFSSQTDSPDAFKIFSLFTDVAAVLGTNPSPVFKCLTVKRTNYDSEAPSATYRWMLNIQGSEEERNPLVKFTPASTPDAATTVVNSDTANPTISRFLSTDYETYAVFETECFGHQCALWVAPDLRDSIPQDAIDKYNNLCGEGVSLYDNNTCSQQQA